MFKKLKNRFLFLNLVIISVMMLASFATIYTITYHDVRRNIDMELRKISDFYRKPRGNFDAQPPDQNQPRKPIPEGSPHRPGPDAGIEPPERSVAFMIQTDRDWNMKSSDSWFTIDRDLYAQALEKAKDEKTNNAGQFKLSGNDWAFIIQPIEDGYLLVFLDVTARQGILTNLIYTFLTVGLVMLIVIYFISRFFATRSIAPVKDAFEKQKQFIADASHELKSPLAVIQTNTDVLLANPEDTIGNQAKWLHYIKLETDRMAKLTNDLLYLTEMESTRVTMLHMPFNMSEAVETILLTMEAVIFEKQLQLDYDIEPDLMVHGSSEQIKQVVFILLDNAIKYTYPNGSLTISLKTQHHDVVLTVSNTGEGIAPEHLSRIFDRFYRTDASRSRQRGGYGLGLAIAKSIVEQHRGKLYGKSSVGATTSFYLHLTRLESR
ncbi:histidine kinase [Paenibacillus alvei TS-15]|jgi:two-component system, OmpR family, sensor histidine kinase CiaH|uniref:histidine kinase n=1 Tax=Paenibacillus alvei TS-15 TaxID=1117108 RepID=S9SJW8_PAEAL|nr:HAMP domain-containing sensor histidine kinase [Paenibacillus alvei]EPY04999.1 histidine kinase [Paenibacillus alvei TS-15]